MGNIKSINIITSPFGCIPPNAIGAVEKLWKSCGDYYISKGLKVVFVSKRPNIESQDKIHNCYVDGYSWTGSRLKDFLLDGIYSFKALFKMPKCDALVLNTIWSPLLLPLFRWKYKVSLYNVARFPKHQLGMYKMVDVLSCVSNVVYDEMIKQNPSTKKQGCVINNFINTEIYKPRRTHSIPKNAITILYTGRINREKGIELLVMAVNEVRKHYDVNLKLIGCWEVDKGGSGIAYVNELNDLCEDWKIEWVDPIYDAEKLAAEMDKADIYCYPSLADKGETFGVAPLEAMGLGIPTIVSALRCFTDFVKDKKSGLVFDHHSSNAVEQIVERIMYILESPDNYNTLSNGAIAVATEFTIENKAEEYLTVLTNVLNHKETGFDIRSMKVNPL